MPKITSVEPQKTLRLRPGRRFNIFLDGKFAFGADEDLVVEYRLVPGKLIDTSLMDKLLFESEIGKLMERMYGLFNIRQRSEREVRNYFKNLSFKRKVKDQDEIPESAIELLINKLKQKRLINDEEFAKSWVQSRSKKKGPRVLKQELFQKGIDREIVEQVMGDVSIVHGGEQTARKLLEKKMRIWKNLPVLEFRKKAFNFLLRCGFDYEVVKSVVGKIRK